MAAMIGIRWKIMAAMAGAAMLSVMVAGVSIIQKSSSALSAQAKSLAEETARRYSGDVKGKLDEAETVSTLLAHQLLALKVDGLASRTLADALIRQALEDHPNYMAVFTVRIPVKSPGDSGIMSPMDSVLMSPTIPE